jgi:hypothetical protein
MSKMAARDFEDILQVTRNVVDSSFVLLNFI